MDWNEIRKKVLERDNYKCQKCGNSEDLEIHHKKMRNNKLNNLITLCNSCHSKIKKKRAIGIMHTPTLKTVLIVEEAIKNCKEYPSKRSLWLSLPKKIMYQTFISIINYLEYSGKIVIDKGKIIWVWDPNIKKYLTSNLVVR